MGTRNQVSGSYREVYEYDLWFSSYASNSTAPILAQEVFFNQARSVGNMYVSSTSEVEVSVKEVVSMVDPSSEINNEG